MQRKKKEDKIQVAQYWACQLGFEKPKHVNAFVWYSMGITKKEFIERINNESFQKSF